MYIYIYTYIYTVSYTYVYTHIQYLITLVASLPSHPGILYEVTDWL